jgi:DNA-binding beta-propeller fold protein YncE
MGRLLSAFLALGCVAAAPPPADPEDARAPIPASFYRLAASARLPGKAPDWDYLALDSARGRLFIARRGAGLWVFDTHRNRLVTRIADSAGAGATLLVPALGRGFSTNEDGSTTVFDLASLRRIARVRFAGDADAASYDPVTGRVAFVSADSRQVTFLDARSLKVAGQVKLEAKKADASVGDGAGHILLNERDRGMVAKIDAATATVLAEWPTTGCSQPTGMAYDPAHHRAFIGCRGAKPVLAVMNTDSGAIVATLDIGRGNDGVIYDAARRRVITSNGVDANLVIFHQDDADHYRVEQAITTRPNARTMAMDFRSGRIFTVTAEGVVNPAAPVNTGPATFYPNAYYDGSMIVLTYAPGGAAAGGRR